MLAELVHHMKTRVPQIRTQESFAHGTASVHVELLIPQSVALSAVLSEQVPVKVSSFLASATECETNGGRRGRRRATHVLHITSRVQFSVGIRQLQVSGWTCSPLSETHAIRRSAASSLRPGAAPKNRASRCASSQEPVLQDGFRSMRSSLLGVLSQASAAFGINLLSWTLRCCNCIVYLCPGRDVCKVCQRCVLHGWAADHKNAIVVDMSSWMRSVLSGAPEISRSAASSLRPGTAPGNCACQCTSQEPVLQRRFRSIRFRLLGLLGQASAACGIDVFPCAFVVTSTLSSAGSSSNHIRSACYLTTQLTHRGVMSLQLEWPTKRAGNGKVCFPRPEQRAGENGESQSGAIVQISGWMRSALSWAPDISPSSLRPGTAPGNCACQCTSQEPVLQRRFRSMRFRLLGLLGQASAVYLCSIGLVRGRCAAAESLAKQIRDVGCMAGLPRPSRAILQGSGWIRPPLASTHAIPRSAASSIRQVAVLLCGSSQCRCSKSILQGCFGSVQSWHVFFSKQGSLLDLGMADAVPPASAERFRFRPTAAGSFARHVCQRVPVPVAEVVSFTFSSPPWLEVGHLSCMSRLLTTSRAIVPLFGWIRSHFPAAHAIRPAATSSGLVAVAAGYCVQCRCSKSILQGCFGSVQSWHVFFSKQGSLLDLVMADAVPPASAERFKPTAAGFFARRVGHLSCWIRSPCPTAHAIRPPAYSFGPVAAPVGICVRRRRRGRLLKGYFGCVLSFYRQEGTHSLLDLCSCVVRFTFPGFSAKQVHDACMAALTTGTGAIVQVSGWIRPPFASVPRILPSPAGTAHDKGKQRSLAGFIGQNVHAPVLARRAHKSSSELCSHSVSCMRFQERDPSRSLRPVRVARKKDFVLRSSGSVAPPSPMKSMPLSPSPLPSAAWVLRLQGAVRSVFRPDIEEAVEANWLVISPVDETLSQAQVPFILMIRHLFSLLPSHALQDREVLLNLVLVGHSHGGVVGHSLAQSLECAGFLVKGIVAVDTLGLPRWSGMPLPRFDPQGLIRNLSPYHWQLTAPTVNMMAPEVPRLFLLFPLCEFPDGIPSSLAMEPMMLLGSGTANCEPKREEWVVFLPPEGFRQGSEGKKPKLILTAETKP